MNLEQDLGTQQETGSPRGQRRLSDTSTVENGLSVLQAVEDGKAFSNGSPAGEQEPPEEREHLEEPEQPNFELSRQLIISQTIGISMFTAGFVAALLAGHIYILAAISILQILSFAEVVAVPDRRRYRALQFMKTLDWYFLGSTLYLLYGEIFVHYFKHVIEVNTVLVPFAAHHRFISFMLYVTGFAYFVTSLQKHKSKFQIGKLAWTHMTLYLVVVQSHFVMINVFEGMLWFIIPVVLVITNDIFAHICGSLFGISLIALSPRKTAGRFLGGWIFTVLVGVISTMVLTHYSYFICPVKKLGSSFWTGLKCTPNPVFKPRIYTLPFSSLSWSDIPNTFKVASIFIHVLVLATVASLIAPFGGVFLSALKRTFGPFSTKNFDHFVPGYGCVIDRIQYHFTMGFFAFMYYSTFIAESRMSVRSIMEDINLGLAPEEQVEVLQSVIKHLVSQDALTASILDSVSQRFTR